YQQQARAMFEEWQRERAAERIAQSQRRQAELAEARLIEERAKLATARLEAERRKLQSEMPVPPTSEQTQPGPEAREYTIAGVEERTELQPPPLPVSGRDHVMRKFVLVAAGLVLAFVLGVTVSRNGGTSAESSTSANPVPRPAIVAPLKANK